MEETPFYYISLLDNSCEQGIIPTCKQNKMDDFIDTAIIKYVCDKEWAYYTAKFELDDEIDFFEDIDIDFVFSPFIIIKSPGYQIVKVYTENKIKLEKSYIFELDPPYYSYGIKSKSFLLYEFFDMIKDKAIKKGTNQSTVVRNLIDKAIIKDANK